MASEGKMTNEGLQSFTDFKARGNLAGHSVSNFYFPPIMELLPEAKLLLKFIIFDF